MQKERRKILLPYGAAIAIAREVGVGRDTVREAVGGLTSSELSDRIRELALTKYGGVERN